MIWLAVNKLKLDLTSFPLRNPPTVGWLLNLHPHCLGLWRRPATEHDVIGVIGLNSPSPFPPLLSMNIFGFPIQ